MKKDKRKMILDAASNCFARYGYKNTTLDDISKIVGFRKAASIYYYFKNEAEIYITLVTNEYRSLITKLYEEIDEDMKCEEKILIYFDKRLEWLYEQSNILTQITQEELNLFNELGTDIVKEINIEEQKNFANILKKCIERGQIQKIDIEKVSNYIFILAGGIYNYYRSPSSVELVTEKETEMIKNETTRALKIFIQGLKSPNLS